MVRHEHEIGFFDQGTFDRYVRFVVLETIVRRLRRWRKDEKARQNESFEGRSEKERCQKVPKEVQRRKKVSYVILIRNNVTRA